MTRHFRFEARQSSDRPPEEPFGFFVEPGHLQCITPSYLLSRRHRVELFESEPRLGGHAHINQVSCGGRLWGMLRFAKPALARRGIH